MPALHSNHIAECPVANSGVPKAALALHSNHIAECSVEWHIRPAFALADRTCNLPGTQSDVLLEWTSLR